MTQANEKPELTTWSKVFVVIAVLLSLGNLINFIFYGQELRNIASSIGFALIVDFHGKLTQGFHPILSHPI